MILFQRKANITATRILKVPNMDMECSCSRKVIFMKGNGGMTKCMDLVNTVSTTGRCKNFTDI